MNFSTYLSFLRLITEQSDPDLLVGEATQACNSLQDEAGRPLRLTNLEWLRHWRKVAERLIELRAFSEAHLACRRGLARGPSAALLDLLGQISVYEGDLQQAYHWFKLTPHIHSLSRKGVRRQLDEVFIGDGLRPVRVVEPTSAFSIVVQGEGELKKQMPDNTWDSVLPSSEFVILVDGGCEGFGAGLTRALCTHIDEDLRGLVWASRYQFQCRDARQIAVLPARMADDLIAVTLRMDAFEELKHARMQKPPEVSEGAIVGLLDGNLGFCAGAWVMHESKFVQS